MPSRQDAWACKTPPRACQNDAPLDKSSLLRRWQKTNFHGAHLVFSVPVLLVQHSLAEIRCLPNVRFLCSENQHFRRFEGWRTEFWSLWYWRGCELAWLSAWLLFHWCAVEMTGNWQTHSRYVLNMRGFFFFQYWAKPLILNIYGLPKLFTPCHNAALSVGVLKQLQAFLKHELNRKKLKESISQGRADPVPQSVFYLRLAQEALQVFIQFVKHHTPTTWVTWTIIFSSSDMSETGNPNACCGDWAQAPIKSASLTLSLSFPWNHGKRTVAAWMLPKETANVSHALMRWVIPTHPLDVAGHSEIAFLTPALCLRMKANESQQLLDGRA